MCLQLKEINDRGDGKIPTLADLDDGGLKLEDLIHMSYRVGKLAKRPEQRPLPAIIDLKADD
jgi:hypothetical protein